MVKRIQSTPLTSGYSLDLWRFWNRDERRHAYTLEVARNGIVHTTIVDGVSLVDAVTAAAKYVQGLWERAQ